MLDKILLSTDDLVWAGILSDLGAIVSSSGIKFPTPSNKLSISMLSSYIEELKSNYLFRIGAENLSESEERLILMLPGSAAELKTRMGYASTSTTHTIETLVYNIRKKLGQNFIKFKNGTYEL